MPAKLVVSDNEARKTVVIDGKRLVIIATKINAIDWSLCVENAMGIRSCWFEIFENYDLAIRNAEKAISEEGVEAFIDIDDFDYMKAMVNGNRL